MEGLVEEEKEGCGSRYRGQLKEGDPGFPKSLRLTFVEKSGHWVSERLPHPSPGLTPLGPDSGRLR